MKRFPQNIKLYAVRDKEGEMIAGTYIFIYEKTIHTQYMTATDEARHCGALDLLIDWLIKEYAQSHEWLDFGISTEENGHWLNEGLIYQKEGFGGRGVCYNQYEIKL
jgi:lipid II:glycine glycyltransferase (peptidoglycan interpeptide bridge formation enzyme)